MMADHHYDHTKSGYKRFVHNICRQTVKIWTRPMNLPCIELTHIDRLKKALRPSQDQAYELTLYRPFEEGLAALTGPHAIVEPRSVVIAHLAQFGRSATACKNIRRTVFSQLVFKLGEHDSILTILSLDTPVTFKMNQSSRWKYTGKTAHIYYYIISTIIWNFPNIALESLNQRLNKIKKTLAQSKTTPLPLLDQASH